MISGWNKWEDHKYRKGVAWLSDLAEKGYHIANIECHLDMPTQLQLNLKFLGWNLFVVELNPNIRSCLWTLSSPTSGSCDSRSSSQKKRLSLFWRSSNMMMILNHSHWYYRVPFSAKQQIRRNFTIFNLWKKDITVFEEIQFIQQQTFIVRHNPLPRRLYTWPWLHQFVNIFLSFFFVRVACIVKPNTFFIIANPIEHTKV